MQMEVLTIMMEAFKNGELHHWQQKFSKKQVEQRKIPSEQPNEVPRLVKAPTESHTKRYPRNFQG